MESSRNCSGGIAPQAKIIKGGQNGVKSQLCAQAAGSGWYYKGGAKWSQVATHSWSM